MPSKSILSLNLSYKTLNNNNSTLFQRSFLHKHIKNTLTKFEKNILNMISFLFNAFDLLMKINHIAESTCGENFNFT